MVKSRLERNQWVVVADGGRVLVMRNDGDGTGARLTVLRKYGQDVPPARELGSDKPGRGNASVGRRRSSMENTDFHQQAEDRLMQEVAAALAEDLRKGEFASLVVAAAPTALGELRRAMSDELRRAVKAEVAKDFTHLHLPELGEALEKALEAA